MPYNTSKAVVHRSRRYLDEMLRAGKSITFPTSDPKRLAYRLREAIYTTTRYKDFTIYHPLHENFRIRPKSGWVEAEYIGPPTDVSLDAEAAVFTVAEVTSLNEVVGAVIKFGSRIEEIHFPNARLSLADLRVIWEWGHKDGWNLIWHDDLGITITRRQGVSEEFFWSPPEETQDA